MKRIMVIGGTIIGIALIITACHLGFSESVLEIPDASDPVQTEPGALVRMRIPTVSSHLLSSLNATYSPRGGSGTLQPQAILFATSADFILSQYDSGENAFFDVNEWRDIGVETNLGQDTGNGDDEGDDENGEPPVMLEHFLEIEPGNGYQLEVKIYNSNVSSGNPVVAGVSEVFDLKAGQSKMVRVTGIPVDPVVIAANYAPEGFPIVRTPFEFTSVAGDDMEDWDVLTFTGIGGELWIKLDITSPPQDYTRIIIDPPGQADVAMLMYDQYGKSMGDRPALGWGFFADVHGGEGGTRMGVIGNLVGPDPENPAEAFYFGALLLDRLGGTNTGDVTLMVDFVDRTPQTYPNVLPASAEGPEFENTEFFFAGRTEYTQIVSTQHDSSPPVHWFILEDVDWHAIDWNDDMLEFWIEVEVTFDVFDREHLYGGRWEEYWANGEPHDVFEPMLALYVGEAEGDNHPAIFTMVTADERDVTENSDGTTTARFKVYPANHDIVGLGDTLVPDVGAVAISSQWDGNQFTFKWDAAAGIIVGVD